MAREEITPERALLWSVYWGLRALWLDDSSPLLDRTLDYLWGRLHAGSEPTSSKPPARPSHLTLVGGAEARRLLAEELERGETATDDQGADEAEGEG